MSNTYSSVLSTDECAICGGYPSRSEVVMFHNVTGEYQIGLVCATCRQILKPILIEQPSTCDKCDAPFPEAGRTDIIVYDPEGDLVYIDRICCECDRDRHD